METINKIWDVFFNNVVSRPAIFIGLIVIFGYILLKKKWYEVLAGFIKAAVGYMILQVGAKNLLQTVNPLIQAIQQKWGIKAVVIDPNFGLSAATAALESIGETLSMAMISLLVAFMWNIFLIIFRKYTKVRTLFTTGHIMVKQAAVATWIIYLLIPSLRGVGGIILTGILCGTYWAVGSNMTVEATNDLTDNAGFAVGHQQMFGVWFADKFAGKVGNKENSVDNFNLKGAFKLLDDYTVSTTIIMGVFFGIIIAIVGELALRELDPAFAKNIGFPLYIFEKAASFAVNLTILKTGVRMFVNELVVSFEGISNSMLKGSVPAVDCAATYGFGATNAITLGFIFGAIGQVIAITLLVMTKNPIFIVPGFVPLFYDNATIGLYANNKGGFRALAIFCMTSGLLQVLGSAFAANLFEMAQFGGYVGNLDWATAWPVFGFIINHFSIIGVVAVILGMLIIPQLQFKNNKEKYFDLN